MMKELGAVWYPGPVDPNTDQLLGTGLLIGTGPLRYLERHSDVTQRLKLIRIRTLLEVLTGVDGDTDCEQLTALSCRGVLTDLISFPITDPFLRQCLFYLSGSFIINHEPSREMFCKFFEEPSVLMTIHDILDITDERTEGTEITCSDLGIIWAAIRNLCSLSTVISAKLIVISLQQAIIGLRQFLDLIRNTSSGAVSTDQKESSDRKKSCHWQMQCILQTMHSLIKTGDVSLIDRLRNNAILPAMLNLISALFIATSNGDVIAASNGDVIAASNGDVIAASNGDVTATSNGDFTHQNSEGDHKGGNGFNNDISAYAMYSSVMTSLFVNILEKAPYLVSQFSMSEKLCLLDSADWHQQYIALAIVRSALELEKIQVSNQHNSQIKSDSDAEQVGDILRNEMNEADWKNETNPKLILLRRKSLSLLPRKSLKESSSVGYRLSGSNDDDTSVTTMTTMKSKTINTISTSRAIRTDRRNSGEVHSSHVKKIRLMSQSFASPPDKTSDKTSDKTTDRTTDKTTDSITVPKPIALQKNVNNVNTRKKLVFEMSCTAELCRTGAVKSICLLLVHSRSSVRDSATKVLTSLLDVRTEGSSEEMVVVKEKDIQELFRNIIELGLFSLLEIISHGYYIPDITTSSPSSSSFSSSSSSSSSPPSSSPSSSPSPDDIVKRKSTKKSQMENAKNKMKKDDSQKVDDSEIMSCKNRPTLKLFPEKHIRNVAENIIIALIAAIHDRESVESKDTNNSSNKNDNESNDNNSDSNDNENQRSNNHEENSNNKNITLASTNKSNKINTTNKIDKIDRIENTISSEKEPSGLLGNILSALQHGGSITLRVNILSAMIQVASRSPCVGRLLWNAKGEHLTKNKISTNNGNNGNNGNNNSNREIFLPLFSFSKSSRDPSELRLFTRLLAEFMGQGSSLVAKWEKKGRLNCSEKKNNGRKDSKVEKVANDEKIKKSRDANNDSKNDSKNESKNGGKLNVSNPIVLLEDREENQKSEGLWVKMACPSSDVIESHSRELSSILKAALQSQVGLEKEKVSGTEPRPSSSTSSNQNDQQDQQSQENQEKTDDDNSISNNDNSNIDYYPRLEGLYSIWQEVFSHMLDDSLLQSSVRLLSDKSLVRCYLIARRYRMTRITKSYADTLVSRLSLKNFSLIFQCALGRRESTSFHAPNTPNAPNVPNAPSNGASDDPSDSNRKRNLSAQEYNENNTNNENNEYNEYLNENPIHLSMCRDCLLFLTNNFLDLLKIKGSHNMKNENLDFFSHLSHMERGNVDDTTYLLHEILGRVFFYEDKKMDY